MHRQREVPKYYDCYWSDIVVHHAVYLMHELT